MEQPELFHHKITRGLLGFLCAFCRLDPLEHSRILEFERQRRAARAGPGALATSSTRATTERNVRWPELVTWLYVYVNIRLISVLCWQYLYDYDFLKLKQIDAKLASMANSTQVNDAAFSETNFRRISELREHHARRYAQTYGWLKTLGQPMTEIHWLAPVVLANLVFLTFLVYMLYLLGTKFKLMERLDLYLVRIMLSEDYETIKSRQLVRACAGRLMDSSRNYVLNLLLRSANAREFAKSRAAPLPLRGVAAVEKVSIRRAAAGSDLEAQLKNHLFAFSHLARLVESGELIPINRSRKWVDRMSLQFAMLSVLNLVYSFVFDTALFYAVPAHFGYFHLDSLMDLLTYIELWVLIEISVLAATLYVPLLQTNTRDQTSYMGWIIERIEKCLVENDKLFAQALGALQCEAARKAINGGLIKTVMEYEVFVGQFKPVQQTFSFTAVGVTSTALICALIVRTHLMYCSVNHHGLAIYFYMVLVIFSDSLLIPLCVINNHSKTLYTRLMSLLSQSIEFDVITSGLSGARGSLDRHLIWQLRNILIDSKRFTQQFAATALPQISMTTPNLIRLHYWYVLLILSYFFRIDAWKTFLGDRQDDPLQLLGHL